MSKVEKNGRAAVVPRLYSLPRNAARPDESHDRDSRGGQASSTFEHLDEALDRAQRLREQLLVDIGAPDRAARLALLFESEARTWSQLYELASLRLVWRAALAAEVSARANARLWTQRAASQLRVRRTGCGVRNGSVHRVPPTPRPAATPTTTSAGRG